MYRNTQNALMREDRQFTEGQGIYSNEEDRFSKFVETVEGIIDDEARKWNTYVQEKNSQKNENEGKVYEQLKPLQDSAIERAKKRVALLQTEHTEVLSRESNPVTTVAELVEYLNSKQQ